MVVHAQVELGDRGSDGRRGHPAVGFKGQGGSRWGVLHGPHWWPRLPGVGRVVAGLPAVWLVTLSVAPLGHAAAGDLDRSFGKHGKVRTNFGGGSAEAMALVLQPDGKLVAAGSAAVGGAFALARYQADGSLDPTFGTGGLVRTNFGGRSDDSATALVLQPDGKLVAAGTTLARHIGDFALVRYQGE